MSYRLASTALVALSLAGDLAAQSTVKPLPQAVMPTSFHWSLAAAYRAVDADAPHERASDQIPRTTLVGTRDSAAAPASAPDDDLRVELELDSEYQPSSDFSHGAGSMDVARAGWDARLGWKTGARQGLTFHLHNEASFYGFSNATGLVPGSGNGRPLNDAYETSLGSTFAVQTSARASWFSAAAVTLSGEDNASLGQAVTLSAVTGLRFQAHEDLALECGLGALTQHEDHAWVIPWFGFDWKIADRWRLSTEGPKVRLAVDLGRDWTLAGEASYRLRQYRLNDDNPLPGGAMRDQEIDLGGTLTWRPSRAAEIRLGAGFVAWREIEFFGRDGDKVSESEVDPAPYVALQIQFSF